MDDLVLATVAKEIKEAFADSVSDMDLIQLLYGAVVYPVHKRDFQNIK